MKNRVNSVIDNAVNSGDVIKIDDFLYNTSNNEIGVRKRVKPNIDFISDEEITKNIELVLLYNNDLSVKQLVKATSRNFGFKSTSKKTASKVNSVLDLMIADNKVKIENDFVELV